MMLKESWIIALLMQDFSHDKNSPRSLCCLLDRGMLGGLFRLLQMEIGGKGIIHPNTSAGHGVYQ